MSGDFFVQDFNILLFVVVAAGLALMMVGCFIYQKWQTAKKIKEKDQMDTPKKPKRRLKKFLRRASRASDNEDQNEMRRQNVTAFNEQGGYSNHGISTVNEIRTESPIHPVQIHDGQGSDFTIDISGTRL